MQRTVVLTDYVFGGLDLERAAVAEIGCELEVAPAADEDTLAEAAGRAAAMLVCYAKVPASVISAAAGAGCRVIARYGIGVDNIDVEAASRAGILVTNVPDYCIDEVADHTMALLMGAARGLLVAALSVREGEWTVPQKGIHRLRGRRLAVIGLGRIGRQVVDRALAFGLEVVGYDPFAAEWSQAGAARAHTLEEALAEADMVSLHAPLTPENRHLIGEQTIALMRRAPLVVNTSRGGLVDLDAAMRALDDGRLSGLALDVTEVEPLPWEHPLRTHPRTLVTPHMSFYSAESQEELQRRAVDEVVRALSGRPPRNPVNAEVLEKASSR